MMTFASGNGSTNAQVAPVAAAKKILVVEADPATKAIYTQALQAQQYIVSAVNNGAEGLNMLITFQPDLVIVDLALPVLDGRTMLHSMRALPMYAKTPVIVVSDTGDIETMKQIKMYENASDFLIKGNISPQELVERVQSYLP